LRHRVIWLATPQTACWTRLFYRRYDPDSAEVVNLKRVPKHLAKKDLSKWIQAPKDFDAALEMRFNDYETTEKDLKKIYGLRTESNPTGIFHTINSDGIGEDDEVGVNQSVETVFELIQGHLARPIPITGK
jgi:adenylate kinase family enzyme